MSEGNGSGTYNPAAYLLGPRKIQFQDLIVPLTLGPHDVRVRMKAVGICGSDVHFYTHMSCGPFVVTDPMVLGHESAGEVAEVGSAVTRCKPGDWVALEPGRGCGRCRYCKGGRYNLCPDMVFFATPPVHGSLAREVVHPEDLCFVLPRGVTLEEGALCEPLAVAVYACQRAGSLAGANVAVLGAGPIGALVFLVARAFGASRVVMCDISEERLAFAESLGAEHRVLMGTGAAALVEADAARTICSTLDERVDVVFDCVGRGTTMRTALHAASPGAKVLLVGMADASMEVPLTAAAAREVDIVGVFRYRNCYDTAVELISSKRVNVLPLVTHRFSFTEEDVRAAYEKSASGGRVVKVMIGL